MSLVNLAHVCSHMQNASKARLGLTSIPVSKLHVNLMLGLQREGFLSSVTLGGPTPPKPFVLQDQPDPDALEAMAQKLVEQPWDAYPPPSRAILSASEREAQRESLREQLKGSRVRREAGSGSDADATSTSPSTPTKTRPIPITTRTTAHPKPPLGFESTYTTHIPANPARRRLWLGLKYWNNEPVLKNMKLISKPTRRIWLTSEDLGKITRTRESSFVGGLTHPGECMFLTTDRGILEARDCVERRIGGMALCRIW